MRKRLLYVAILCFLIIGIGCSNTANKGTETNSESDINAQTSNTGDAREDQTKNNQDKLSITLYFSDKQAGKLIAEKREVDQSTVLNNPEQTIVAELIKGPVKQDLAATIPNGTRLLSVKKDGTTLTLDFSKEFVENHSGGSAGETLTIYSIVNSLTELKDVENIKFLIEGQERKEYKGHYEFDMPFARNEEIINKN